MLNCIIATILPNSGMNLPSTPASFMRRSVSAGSRREVRIDRKSRFASSLSRSSSLMSDSERVTTRNASGCSSRLLISAMWKSRIRLTGSFLKTSGLASAMRPRSSTNSTEPGILRTRWAKRLRTPERPGTSFAWRSSSAAQTMRVRSPTSFATRK
ncbi:hypothetical protein D3C72_1691650 [compost metagenome]